LKVIIIYQTNYGNNRIIGQYAASTLEAWGHEVDLHNVYDITPNEVKGADFYLFCSPTHMGKAPRKIRSFLKAFAKVQKEGKYATIVTGLPISPEKRDGRTEEMLDTILSETFMTDAGSLRINSLNIKGPLEEGWEKKVDAFLETVI